ncbi:DMT family transporter [Phaeobacter sp. B1627]|uniref:DMT family transporter n=1 Tax=Phaeobacter sp. B1627 TaxID=2583809 RepID=UPI0011196577|nr:DMT family transporter [Phaeobacter sp. B1627]TNJ44043.1 DMT family transporter [Phaeobacter sp. B1627]
MRLLAHGILAVFAYTGLIAAADGITKFMAAGFAPAQLFAVSGLLVAGFCFAASRVQGHPDRLRTRCPGGMAVRAGATVLACTCFYYAFRYLALAEVFVFVALMPLMAALLSGLILKERIRPAVWLALCVGVVGLLVMQPGVHVGGVRGSVLAMGGMSFGTLSIVMARYVSRYDSNVLAQVFYPNLTLGLVMLCLLPFVWRPMTLLDCGWVVAYAVLLFGARWLLVLALRHLPAYTVAPLLNLQFVWMTLIGLVAFGEIPLVSTFLGMAVVAASGVFLVWDQMQSAGAGRSASSREESAAPQVLSPAPVSRRGRSRMRGGTPSDEMQTRRGAWRAGR